MKRILTVVGARPQFIKASVVSKAIQGNSGIREILLHTGQHFDTNMSDIFFNQLGIPKPNYQLDVHGGSHGSMTGRMLAEIERVILECKPDRILVYGDTNSTLAGALAAAKLNLPVAHIEAGLRSFNRRMPEEINRVLTDQICDLLFCPTTTAVENLINEGFEKKPVRIVNSGDVMHDAAKFFAKKAVRPANFPVQSEFILTTLHRAENTDDRSRLKNLVEALNSIHSEFAPIVMPIHPRTRAAIKASGLNLKVNTIPPLGYFEMLWLLDHCALVVTDSGGLQKEAFFFGKACVTVRDETEWVELVDLGANMIAGSEPERIRNAVQKQYGRKIIDPHGVFGAGHASESICRVLIEH